MGRETTRTSDRVRPSRRTRLFLLAVFAALLAVAPAAAQTGTALVGRVIDGDTIRVRMAGAPYTVRLTGVDTPETKHPTLGVQPFGPEASAYTTARLTGATVRLDLDPAGDASDTCFDLTGSKPRWLRGRRRAPMCCRSSSLRVSWRRRSASRGGRENRADRCRRVRTVLRAMLFRSTYARHGIRHGIRHTAALAGRRTRPPVANDRLRHMLIG